MYRKRRYYTLLTRDPDDLWVPQFGDYDRAVVAQEGDDTKKDYPKGTKMKIIATSAHQYDINAVINEMNKRIKERRT